MSLEKEGPSAEEIKNFNPTNMETKKPQIIRTEKLRHEMSEDIIRENFLRELSEVVEKYNTKNPEKTVTWKDVLSSISIEDLENVTKKKTENLAEVRARMQNIGAKPEQPAPEGFEDFDQNDVTQITKGRDGTA